MLEYCGIIANAVTRHTMMLEIAVARQVTSTETVRFKEIGRRVTVHIAYGSKQRMTFA